MGDPEFDDPQFWLALEAAFAEALAAEEPARGVVVQARCAGQPRLRAELDRLLAAHAQAADFIEPARGRSVAALLREAEQPDPHLGRMLSHYRILDELSRGGMGIVYRALDVKLGREVALKVLLPELVADRDRQHRFAQEARAAAALEHPHVATIHEIDEAAGVTFITMELIRGETLATILRHGPLEPTRALDLALEVAEGLAHAHEHGIVHRDLKPGNIMLSAQDHAKLIDFGLATLIERVSGSALETCPTARDGVMGTVAYMSPEQALGSPVDQRSDIFSFGSVLFEMLAGGQPFKAANDRDTLHAILHAPAARLPAFASGVPELQRVLDYCMAKDPLDRYQSMDAVIVDLRTVWRRLQSGSQPGQRPAAAVSAVAEAPPSRQRLTAALVGWGLLAGGAAVAVWLARSCRVVPRQQMGSRAVLPIDGFSAAARQECLADGLADLMLRSASAGVP